MAILFTIHRTDRDYFSTADQGQRYYVGRRVSYEENIGLYNIFRRSPLQKLNYAAADFAVGHGFWSTFIEPTAVCEGLNFLTLNSYDRAAFTFGFAQFAAHVPNGDFVRYFRALLQLPQAGSYFPHLAVVGDRICQVDAASPVEMETDQSTRRLMDYLNPTLADVEDAEVIAAAKLIHWTANSVEARDAQVKQMVETYKGFMARADRRLGIEGKSADLCCVIADILHHGRGGRETWPQLEAALKASKPLDALIAIGAPRWETRKTTLRKAIVARPELAAKAWDSAKADFV